MDPGYDVDVTPRYRIVASSNTRKPPFVCIRQTYPRAHVSPSRFSRGDDRRLLMTLLSQCPCYAASSGCPITVSSPVVPGLYFHHVRRRAVKLKIPDAMCLAVR